MNSKMILVAICALIAALCIFSLLGIYGVSRMTSSSNPMLSRAPEEFYGGTSLAIAKAIRERDRVTLKKLLQSPGFDPRDKGLKGVPLILWAASHDNMEAVRDLLAAKVPANDTVTQSGITYNLVALAAGSENPEFIIALLQAGGNPDGLPGTEAPLFTALFSKRWDRMDLLLKQGAQFDLPNSVGMTPLMKLANINEYEQVLKFLKLGADPDRQSATGISLRSIIAEYPLDPLSEKGKAQRRVIEYLEQRR